MKKLIAVLLSLTLVFSFAGCSSEESGSEEAAEMAAASDAGALGDYEVVIKDFQIMQDYEGNDAIVVSYDFTNNSEEAASFDVAMMAKPFQSGVELEYTSVYESEDSFDALNDSTMTEIQPGATIEVMTCHKLNDLTNPVDVEVEEFLGFSDDKLVKTFEIAQ